MTISNAIAKISKKTNSNPTVKGQEYSFTFGRYILSFYQNGRYDEITCINTRRIGDESNSMVDYHAGTYHDNITRALKYIGA
jgi:hypothetical protein